LELYSLPKEMSHIYLNLYNLRAPQEIQSGCGNRSSHDGDDRPFVGREFDLLTNKVWLGPLIRDQRQDAPGFQNPLADSFRK
ncbi:MAG: hypothetical protein QGF68_15380, partial [Nitrospinota bacterium]|nr:hypothetical protein [Nitrospinota bacterium]